MITYATMEALSILNMCPCEFSSDAKRVFEKSWFHQSIEHEAECDRVDYPRRLDSAIVILATEGTFQTFKHPLSSWSVVKNMRS
jgi:hypothetical protein